MRFLNRLTAVTAVGVFLAAFASAQTTFTNSTTIVINDESTATPYPSTITVSGMGSAIANSNTAVRVTINGLSHTFPDDIGIVLVSPTGAALLLQDGVGDGTDVTGLTYTISDSGASQLPTAGTWTAGGTFKPAGYYATPFNATFPAPGPGTAYNHPGPGNGGTATFQSTFSGLNPNGTWRLYVVDALEGDFGDIGGGWSLTITTSALAADATVSGTVVGSDGHGLTGATVVLTDTSGVARSTTSGRRGSFAFTEVETGETYVLTVKTRQYKFAPMIIQINDSLTGIRLSPEP